MKEWTMRAPLFTFSMNEKARGSALHFLNEGNCKGVPLFSFSMKEWTIGAPLFTFSMKQKSRDSAHHFLDEGKGDGFHSPLPQ